MLKVTEEFRNYGGIAFRKASEGMRMARVYRINGRFQVESLAQVVRGGGAEVRLRRKTFKVLELLIENRDRAVSKSEILDTVWEGTAVTDDVLVTSITEIRRAFADDSRSPAFVQTIHGT